MRLSIRHLGVSVLAAVGSLAVLAVLVIAVAHADTSRRAVAPPVVRTSQPAPRGTHVALLGDSISFLSESAYRDRFDARGFDAPVISGIPGIRSDERVVEGADLVRPSSPRVLVIELGTNDVGQFVHDHPGAAPAERDVHARSVAENEAQLAAGAGAQVECVVVVNVSGNTLSPEANDVAHAEDRAFEDWARRDPRVRIADWDQLLFREFAEAEPTAP